MQTSITSWSFPACNLDEAWNISKALGICHMDIGLLHVASLNRAQILSDPIHSAKKLLETGIESSNLYWLFGQTPAERELSDSAHLDQNLQDFEQVCQFAAKMGIPTLFLLPGVPRPNVSAELLFEQSAQSLRKLMPIAQAHNIILTVEPHIGGILSSPDMALAMVRAVPGLKLTLDYAHFICMGYSQEQIDPLAAHAAHIHLRQARPGALQTKFSEGTTSFGAMIETLRDAHYDGFMSIEYVHQPYMNTVFDDVLTETIIMRDLLRTYGIS